MQFCTWLASWYSSTITPRYRPETASARAVAKVEQYGLLTTEETKGCRKVLTAAAMTYVAATASAGLQLLRLVLLFGGNNRRRD